jgi:tripartite-type tricarboxylate transporter receptor subunit TctC
MDNIARTLGEEMSGHWARPSWWRIGPARAATSAPKWWRAPADGYTLIIVANGMAVNPALYGKLSYDPVKDFAPVSLLAVVPNVLVANKAKNSAKTVAEVIANAKAKPGKYTYASAGNGTSIHWPANCSRRWPMWTCCISRTRDRARP